MAEYLCMYVQTYEYVCMCECLSGRQQGWIGSQSLISHEEIQSLGGCPCAHMHPEMRKTGTSCWAHNYWDFMPATGGAVNICMSQ